jgi:hypothetical protein
LRAGKVEWVMRSWFFQSKAAVVVAFYLNRLRFVRRGPDGD